MIFLHVIAYNEGGMRLYTRNSFQCVARLQVGPCFQTAGYYVVLTVCDPGVSSISGCGWGRGESLYQLKYSTCSVAAGKQGLASWQAWLEPRRFMMLWQVCSRLTLPAALTHHPRPSLNTCGW